MIILVTDIMRDILLKNLYFDSLRDIFPASTVRFDMPSFLTSNVMLHAENTLENDILTLENLGKKP